MIGWVTAFKPLGAAQPKGGNFCLIRGRLRPGHKLLGISRRIACVNRRHWVNEFVLRSCHQVHGRLFLMECERISVICDWTAGIEAGFRLKSQWMEDKALWIECCSTLRHTRACCFVDLLAWWTRKWSTHVSSRTSNTDVFLNIEKTTCCSKHRSPKCLGLHKCIFTKSTI